MPKLLLALLNSVKCASQLCNHKAHNRSVSLLHGPKADASSTQDSDSPNVSFTLAPGHDNASRIPLRSVSAVAAHITFVEDAQSKVTDEMQNMVRTGLGTLVRHCIYLNHQLTENTVEPIPPRFIPADSVQSPGPS